MRLILLGLTLLFLNTVSAQEILTLDQAKEITLANNFGIKIAKNNVEIAKNQTARRANNYLPNVSASGGLNSNFGSSTQQFSTGQEANFSNAFTWGAQASVNAAYTIYDKRREITLDQLQESLNASDLQLRQTIEQNLLQVYTSYFTVAQLTENIEVLEETIKISQERLKREQFRTELGQGKGIDVLNARVDVQRDSLNLLNAKLNVANEKRNLNVAMGRSTDVPFAIEISTDPETAMLLEEIIAQTKKENITLELNRQNLAVSELNLNIIDAENRPTVNAGASLDLNYSDNPRGAFIEQSYSQGLAANIGVNYTIFDGSRSIRRQNTVLNLANQKLQIDQLEQQIERDVVNTWQNYQNEIFIVGVQESAVETNQENFRRTEELLRSGQISSIEFRQAQLNLLNAQVSLNNSKYTAKLREIQLKQLMGKLID